MKNIENDLHFLPSLLEKFLGSKRINRKIETRRKKLNVLSPSDHGQSFCPKKEERGMGEGRGYFCQNCASVKCPNSDLWVA